MGQKCSCFIGTGDKTTVYFNQPTKTPDENDGNDENFLINEPYSKAANRAKLMIENKIINKISKFQSITRGVILREKFINSLKSQLKEEDINQLENEKNTFYTDVLKEAERKYPEFDKMGWIKFYPSHQDNFTHPNYNGITSLLQINYGQIIFTILRKYVDSFYTGYVNFTGKRHGYGELVYKNGTKYQGHWLDDFFMGWGRFIDLQGNLNEGIIS